MKKAKVIDMVGFPTQLTRFFVALQEKNQREFKTRYPNNPSPIFALTELDRFYRIDQKYASDEKSGRAYAFIDRTNGDIFKPVNSTTPTKRPSGNIFSNDLGLICCETHGVKRLTS